MHPDLKALQPSFQLSEVLCRCGCGKWNLHPGFAPALTTLRKAYDRPMIVNSFARCERHNNLPAAAGGAGGTFKSLHICDHPQHPGQLGCMAIDISATDPTNRARLFQRAHALGWSIGTNIPRSFLHLDRRDFVGLPQTIFTY
jgi:Peptidase M15